MPSYLEQLTLRLALGVAALPQATRSRHAGYVLAAQRPDGGFGGREGGSDLYYTGFALRSLAVLGELQGSLAERVAAYLRARFSPHASVVDLVSLVYGVAMLESAAGIHPFAERADDWRGEVAGQLVGLRRDDGGFAKTPRGAAGSTYHTFLAALCLQLLERPLRQPERAVQFVLSQRCKGGGFREIRVAKRAGTNPTAAAVGTLRLLDALGDDLRDETIRFLVTMQNEEGGLRANTRIPVADLLSTFTGLLTLVDVDALTDVDIGRARRYAASLERAEGGFHGAAWDTGHDVEYTFYGLGCLALLD